VPVQGSPALKIVDSKGNGGLVISDLHLGFETALSEKGIIVPSQNENLLESIIALGRREKASRLIFIGDVKASESKTYPEEWQQIPYFFDRLIAEGFSVDVIPGNHDGGLELMLPSGVDFHSARGMIIELANGDEVGLFHGHAWPAPELFSCEFLVIGHNHWAVELRDNMGARVRQPVWVISKVNGKALAKAFLESSSMPYSDPEAAFKEKFGETPADSTLISMPAFNPFLRGRPINSRLGDEGYGLGPLLKGKIISIEEAEVFLLDGTYLGKVSQLPHSLFLGRRSSF